MELMVPSIPSPRLINPSSPRRSSASLRSGFRKLSSSLPVASTSGLNHDDSVLGSVSLGHTTRRDFPILHQLHKGIKKSGIMGFCDCCPGEPKQLYVEYMYKGNRYEVMVDDYEELRLPQEEFMI